MQENKYKNTIILKNIPSNLIEKAIIVLKEKDKTTKIEKIEGIFNKEKESIKEGYIVKEAEMIIKDYAKKIEREKYKKVKISEKKYIRLKRYSYLATLIAIIQLLLYFF